MHEHGIRRAINSLTWTINRLTSIRAGFYCQMSYEKAFGFQSLLELGIEEKRLRLCVSAFLSANQGNSCVSAPVHPTADKVPMRVA